jgi:hypothetical protein
MFTWFCGHGKVALLRMSLPYSLREIAPDKMLLSLRKNPLARHRNVSKMLQFDGRSKQQRTAEERRHEID